MKKRWLDLGSRVLVSLALLYCVYLMARSAMGSWYFEHPSEERIRKAIAWDPQNAGYYAALARVLERSPEKADVNEVIRLLTKATQLDPSWPGYWAELGSAYAWAGRTADAERAYEQARLLFPNSPDINWQLANFYMLEGRTREGLEALQKVLLGKRSLRLQAFHLAWRATDDAPLILAEMIPARTDVFFAYIDYLVEQQRISEAGQAWARLLALELRFDPRLAFPYLDALIQSRRIDDLKAAWIALAERDPTRILRNSSDPNVLTNGDFESPLLDGGLDWRVVPAEGVTASVDTLNFFDGAHSLKIEFDGKHNVDYGGVWQYVLVEPNKLYSLLGYMRAEGITTDSGPRFQIFDAYDSAKPSRSTENLTGTSDWAPQQVQFSTPPDTRLLVIRVARPPSKKLDSQIAGSVWIDRVSLKPVE